MGTERITFKQAPWENFSGPNLGYLGEQYEQFLNDPAAVDPELRELFEQFGAPPILRDHTIANKTTTHDMSDVAKLKKVVAADSLVQNIRTYGHLAANIHPLEHFRNGDTRMIDPEYYGLSEQDLRDIPAKVIWEEAPDSIENGLDAVKRLRQLYTESISYEFTHVHDPDERKWLNHMVETGMVHRSLSTDEQIGLLKRLTEVEGFEQFLHRTFVGQKRFSIEGLDMLVPMLDEVIRQGVHDGARNIMIGMAHRGRLNVLAHVLGKSYEDIFSEFHTSPNKDLVPSEGSMGINFGWTGDVKYHLGANHAINNGDNLTAQLTLANNPSHLEFVNPVVEGFARAAQEDRDKAGYPSQDTDRAFAILVHGDAAFPGEGIVAETLNMSRLTGYHVGGTVHIIANNRIGFTTESEDDRSTKYASDLAIGFEIPVVHVNADDPEACLAAVYLATEYRARFKKDFVIDLCGYRRYGHNEMDDPFVTQPQLYTEIQNHPTVRTIYADKLLAKGTVTQDTVDTMQQSVKEKLQNAYNELKKKQQEDSVTKTASIETLSERLPKIKTSVPINTLREINDDFLKWPQSFKVYPKLERILKRREKAFEEGGKIDWAQAEALAFATILADGKAVRLTGQDTERGTFAHRHLVLHNHETGETYSPLHKIPQAKASFAIHNSPLSEASVLGFEYGYNVYAPEVLVLWEAQYGDFANVAQVIFDQFISAGRAKWSQRSSLVMLLPHGYEGQGPEHSSARPERFLQMAADNNWTIANLTASAQYFHILRRQAAITEHHDTRPLIILTPKSLIRNAHTASPPQAFSEGKFQFLIEQPGMGKRPEHIERLIFCSGKVGIDLLEAIESGKYSEDDLQRMHIVRIEQLYPFPQEEIADVIGRYQHLKEIVWVQEEPMNMGAWSYMEPRLNEFATKDVEVRYIGRPRRSSPAEGLPDLHNQDQERIINEALNLRAL